MQLPWQARLLISSTALSSQASFLHSGSVGKLNLCTSTRVLVATLLATAQWSFYRVSRVFESLVKDQLQAHCLKIHAIPDEQFGFLPQLQRSTVWQLLSVVDDWDRALDSGSAVHACFIDMAKAFDRVDHALLSHVLSTLGVSGIELRWFKRYLHERSVCTVVEQH